METILVSVETKKPAPRHIAQLEDHLGYWLRRVSNAVSGTFSRALQERQTSVAEWVLLRELHARGQATPGELADVLGMTRGAISKVVDKLEAKKWIDEKAKDGDSRVRLLSLTREGQRNLPDLARVADENDARFFDYLDASEKHALRNLLVKLADHHRIHNAPTQ